VTEKRHLEAQLLQSQKVQAIGQLTAGVAHDFNNILTAIIGYGDLTIPKLSPGSAAHGNVKEMRKAALRAAALTRQLLAFSRKQILQPRVLALDTIITEMDKMLRRLLGEHIDLATISSGDAGNVKADPGQVEQVLLNLAVNARDAMPRGGTLTIETRNITLDENYAAQREEVVAGEYVMLGVSDTGTGMPPEVLARLFEPFFTTKEQGKGTGLGLATCLGIVKQSGGHIAVYSEIGKGTTFKIYLPRVNEAAEPWVQEVVDETLPLGRETILLVEDEPMLLELGLTVLGELGYRVFIAANGRDALRVLLDHPGENFDLLLTDVVMPEMGGKELVGHLRTLSPDTKIVYCSGYAEDAIFHNGGLEPGVLFLEKPYTVAAIAQKVRDALAPW